jgi:phosphatidylserine decarboxylase
MFLHKMLQHLLPHMLLSKIAHLCASNTIPCIKNYLISYFLKRHDVNMSEAKNPHALTYVSFNDFFTRELKIGARKIATTDFTMPADGVLAEFGAIQNNNLIQAKGYNYSLASLLANNLEQVKLFSHGSFATVYLAPHNYHRVHAPASGSVEQMIYVPGRLFSVNLKTTNSVPNIFAKNERLITILATDDGPVAVIFVGAMIVGGISTSWAGTICPPHTNKVIAWDYTQEQSKINLSQGQDMGKFLLGSTVIVLTSKPVRFMPNLTSGASVLMGQGLATLT